MLLLTLFDVVVSFVCLILVARVWVEFAVSACDFGCFDCVVCFQV